MICDKIDLVVCLLALASFKVISEKVPCGYTFNADHVNILCNVTDALPGAKCTWYYWKSSKWIGWESIPSQHHQNKRLMTCVISIQEPNIGTNTVQLGIKSRLQGADKLTGNVKYIIEAPRNSPIVTTNKGVMKDREVLLNDGEDVILECHHDGGVPRVYSTRIVCDMNKQYETYGKVNQANHSLWIKVNLAWDQTSCTCYTHHISSPKEFRTALTISVISPPVQPTCSSTFVDASTAQVTCTTTRVYPRAECDVRLRHPASSQLVFHQPQHGPSKESGYYTTTCLTSFVLTNQPFYLVDVEMYPYVPNYNTNKTPGMKSAKVSVTVEPPNEPPTLTVLSGDLIGDELTVRDGDNVTVHCLVTGGKPSVIRTQIDCGWRRYTNIGSSATFSIRVDINMHQHVCVCYARHVSEKYDLTTAFSLNVQTRAVIDSLQFLPPPGHMTSEYTPGSRLSLWCNVTGNPKPNSSLIYVKDGRQLDHSSSKASQKTIRYFLKYSMTATCNNTGEYRCSVSNHLNTMGSSREIELKVNCQIHHCNTSDDMPSFGVPVGEYINISLCVIAYQTPIEITLHAGNGSVDVDQKTYGVNFTDTDKKLSRGMVNITMYNLTVGDLGIYSLRFTLPPHGPISESILNFTLYAKGRPFCPYNLTLRHQTVDHAILTWMPGFDGGLPQTFVIVLSTPNSSNSSPGLDGGVVVEHVPQTQTGVMAYNLTGVSNWTHSVFYVQPENAKGASRCPEAKIVLTTPDLPDVLLSVILYSASSVTLTALLLGVLIGALRKPHKKTHFDAVEERSGVEKKRGECTVQNHLNPENNCIESEPINLYTKDIHCSKKAGSSNKGGFTARKPAPDEGRIYANVKSLQDTRQDDNPSQGINDNVGPQMASKTTGPYKTNEVNVKNKVCNQVDGSQSGRTVSPGGLIYLSVVVDPKTAEAQIHKSQAMLPRQRTEYMTLDRSATSKCSK